MPDYDETAYNAGQRQARAKTGGLKLSGNWKDAIKRSFQKKRPKDE
jgi:hypothetical protein